MEFVFLFRSVYSPTFRFRFRFRTSRTEPEHPNASPGFHYALQTCHRAQISCRSALHALESRDSPELLLVRAAVSLLPRRDAVALASVLVNHLEVLRRYVVRAGLG